MGDREEHSKPIPILAQAAQSPTESASLLRLDGEANESTPAPAHETPAATRIAPATARSDSAAFAFDLFVVHAEADAPFVHEYLLPALGLPADRVLLVDDLRPGEPLVAEFERGVSRSRFTVPVLSPAYLRDQWAVFG